MGIWVIGTLNQLFIRGFYAQINFSKNKVVSGTPHSMCLNIGFWQGIFLWKCCAFNRTTLN